MVVFAIIVTYESDIPRLDAILAALQPQCRLVVADNSPSTEKSVAIRECVERHLGIYLSMQGNRGIGAAQNHAIKVAWEKHADAVLLLDDDSAPPPDLVANLIGCRCPERGEMAVFGANAVDVAGKEISNARRVPGDMPRCRDMMSSGSLIRREVFEKVGPFDEELFIDCVDFDWGWRAQKLGIPLYLCRAVAITHRLGIGSVGGVRIPSPIRHYYQFRNVLHMLSQAHTPWAWRIAQAFKLPLKLLLMPVLMPDAGMRLRFAFAGIRDAVRGHSGKWQAGHAAENSKP